MYLNVTDLQLGYRSANHVKTVLEKVNFQVEQGKITCLLGASGVGKSTLLRVLAGLVQPLRGQVTLADKAITQPQADIGFVFQSANLLPWLSVQENIAFGLDFACRPKPTKAEMTEQIKAILQEVGLTDVAEHFPNALSGGMAQRVNLARALARDPKLILLDEPFSALDPIIREQMQQLLIQLVKKHHTTAVMITHDIDEALNIADHILLLGKKGDSPANIVGQWDLSSDFPRENLRQLNELRLDILQALQRYQARQQQEQTIEYII